MSDPGAAIWPAELTPELSEVLGMVPWDTGRIAHAYRAAGHDIPRKMEAEQAFVLHRLAGHALRHGPDWRRFAGEELNAILQTIKAKADAS